MSETAEQTSQDIDPFIALDAEINGEPLPKAEPEQESEDIEDEAKADELETDEPGADQDQDEDEQTDDDDSESDEPEPVDYNMEIEVPMPFGMEKMTVGQLKDEVAKIHLTEQQQQKRGNELMAMGKGLNEILNAMGEIPEATMQKVEQLRQYNVAREAQLMLNAIPEWSDNATYIADRKGMANLAKEYGFSETEFNQTSDHRYIKLLRDYTQVKARIEKAKETVRPVKTKPKTKPGRKASRKPGTDEIINVAAKSNKREVKDAAINQLLKGI